jgi:gamma-glutamylcyclotransferase (GGCT)/AIG2-like uncharacterized protein YtfP
MRAKELETIIYFAYGHNTSTGTMMHRCPSAELIGVGVLHNFKLVLSHYANIENDDSAKVYGVLWRITPKDLKVLDSDEGLHDHYNRIPVEVHSKGRMFKSTAYIMDPAYHPNTDANDNYIKAIAKGYSEHGIPRDQLTQAIADQ